jgi:hypothetical protein
MLENIIFALLIPLGLICLVKPILLVYLFSTLMVLNFAPAVDLQNNPILRIGSINIFAKDYLTIILSLLIMIIVARNLVLKRHLLQELIDSQINKLIFALFIWSIFIGFLSYGKGFELQNVLRHISTEALMFIAVIIPTIPGVEQKKERFYKYSILLGLLLVAFALWKYLISHDIEITSSGTVRTLLGNTVVIFMLPICYMLFYSKYYRQRKLFSYTIITLLTIGITLTGHRSGLVTLAFVILLYFMTSDFKILDYLWVPTSIISIVILVVLISPMLSISPGKSLLGDMVLRAGDTFNLENKTTQERLSKWSYSYEIMSKSPLLGLGQFPVHTDSIDEEDNLKLKSSFTDLNKATHNIFAEQLANTGLLGVSIIIIFIYVVLRQFKNISTSDPRYTDFFKAYFWAFLVFSQFNTSFTDPLGKIFLFIMLGFLNAYKMKEPDSLPALSSYHGPA